MRIKFPVAHLYDKFGGLCFQSGPGPSRSTFEVSVYKYMKEAKTGPRCHEYTLRARIPRLVHSSYPN